MRMQCGPVVPRPGRDFFSIGRVTINADHYLGPFRIAITPRRTAIFDVTRLTVDGIQVHSGVHGRQLFGKFDVQRDRLVIKLSHEIRFPVPLQARRIERVEHCLEDRMRHRPDHVEGCSLEFSNGRKHTLCRFSGSRITPYDAPHLLVVKMFGKRWSWWNRQEREKPAVGCALNKNDVTTPKLPPPPRTAQKRSGCSLALEVTKLPSASTISTASKLSIVRPHWRVK